MKDLGWAISCEVESETLLADDYVVGELLDELLEFGAAVSGSRDGTRYGATFSLRRVDLAAGDALSRGIRIFKEAAARAGMPAGEIVWAEIMTFEEQDRRLSLP